MLRNFSSPAPEVWEASDERSEDLATLYAARERCKVGRRMNNELNFPPNFEGLVLGCIDADFCE